jgi:hypothetical protein
VSQGQAEDSIPNLNAVSILRQFFEEESLNLKRTVVVAVSVKTVALDKDPNTRYCQGIFGSVLVETIGSSVAQEVGDRCTEVAEKSRLKRALRVSLDIGETLQNRSIHFPRDKIVSKWSGDALAERAMAVKRASLHQSTG